MLNKNLNNFTNWLNANNIFLNVDKIEMILFKPIKKHLDFTKLHQLNILELKLINILTGRVI